MPRIARLVIPGYPHHIIMRGNNREIVFSTSKDKEVYIRLFKKYTQEWGCEALSYCLMPNHSHFLLVPIKQESLAKAMQGLSLTYTQYFNKEYNRTGRIWESRFRSCIVNKDDYLWMVLKYIETNPVRANLVSYPEDYPWSSAKYHLLGIKNELVKDIDYIKEKYSIFKNIEYREYLKEGIDIYQSKYFYKVTLQGKPIGRKSFIDSLEKRYRIKFPRQIRRMDLSLKSKIPCK